MKTKAMVEALLTNLKKEHEKEVAAVNSKFLAKIETAKSLASDATPTGASRPRKEVNRRNNPIQKWIAEAVKVMPKEFKREDAVAAIRKAHPEAPIDPVNVGACLFRLGNTNQGLKFVSRKRHTGNVYSALAKK